MIILAKVLRIARRGAMEMSEEASATTQRVKGAWTRAGAVGVREVVCF